MAVFAIGLPTIYAKILPADAEWDHMVQVSRWSSVLLLFTYLAYLYFQLSTHRSLFEDDEEDDEEPPDLSPFTASVLLGVATVITTFSTDFLIGAMRGTMESWKLSQEFIGIIMLPIIGNA